MQSSWTIDTAREHYSLPYWSDGYYDIDPQGRVVVRPHGDSGPSVVLAEVIEAARARGLQLPILVRFTDILSHKRDRMQAAFAQAMADYDYQGGYTAVFPIKVNQQRSVVSELVRKGGSGFGLEAGSKPELMAVLALSPGGTVVCNGYKDREYIRLALIGRKLGLDVYIVIEKANELGLVIEEARRLGVQPLLGVRMRLASIGHGKWQNTGGDKAKFGLMPGQLLDLVKALDAAGMKDCLRLVHFHMGSQISNVRDIANGMREAVRYFVELRSLGLSIDTVDVGGGYLTLTRPWPGMLRGIWGDPQRYQDTYWSRWPQYYFAGDGAKLDEDGAIWLLGRVDDVMNVSGHRISTTEVESALVSHELVAEAAVVGASNETTGQGIVAFVILRSDMPAPDDVVAHLRNHVAKEIGPIAKPRQILVVNELPKTRSGKIMRRLLRDVAENRSLGDVTTLADPSVMNLISEGLSKGGD